MGRLGAGTVECQFKGYNRLLTEQLFNGLNDDGMVDEILKEVAALEDNKDASELVLAIDAQKAQKSTFHEITQKALTLLNDI